MMMVIFNAQQQLFHALLFARYGFVVAQFMVAAQHAYSMRYTYWPADI